MLPILCVVLIPSTVHIADALLRYPVFGPAEDNFNVDTAIKCLRSLTAEPESLKSIYKKQNEAYKLVMTELRNNADFSKLPLRNFKDLHHSCTAILLARHEKLNYANDRVVRVVPERQAKQAENNNSHISTFKSSVTHETCGSRFI